jgi:hypothetical protein
LSVGFLSKAFSGVGKYKCPQLRRITFRVVNGM